MPSHGTTRQRGYGQHHRNIRKQWEPKVAAGKVDCWRCGERIHPGADWDLGHSDDRTRYMGPEHPHCNRATAGRKARADASRPW